VNAKTEDERGGIALMMAAGYGQSDIVKLLLDAGADVNAQDVRGRTASMWAEKKGHTELVELLKKAGAKK
jgi:serine/threonine-protein phosphatase 6 regulatory ankyrin repeat subunit B